MKCRIDLRGRQVLSPNYQESVLFNQLLSLTQDFQEALDFYAVTETQDFKDIYGGLEPSLRNLMIYTSSFEASPMTKTEVIEIMRASNFTNSNELLRALEKSEKEGILIFTKKNLQKSGIFTNFASENALERQQQVQDLVNYLRQNEDIIIQEFEYENSNTLTEVGQVQVEPIANEVTFEGKISDMNVLDPVYNEGLSQNIAFLRSGIRDTSWETMGQQVTSILLEVERQAVENGVDLRGLSDSYLNKSKEEVLSVLDSVEQALSEDISEQELNIVLNDYFQREPIKRNRVLKDSEVLLKTDLSEVEVYSQMGLIKVSDNVYRRVINNSGIMFDSIEDEIEYIKGNLGIETYISKMNASKIEDFWGDYDYLTQEFPLEFGKYLVETENNYFTIDEDGINFKDDRNLEIALDSISEEFLRDLEQYSLLSKSMTLPYEVESIPEYEVNEFQMERDKVIANPYLVNEFFGDYSFNRDVLITLNEDSQFLRIKDSIYEIVENDGNASYYMELSKPSSVATLDNDKPIMESERVPIKTSTKEIEIKKTNNKNYKC